MDNLTSELNDKIAIIGFGAYEQHGPHLPAETDTIIVQAILDKLAQYSALTEKIIIFPTQAIGYSVEHSNFASTKSLSFKEALDNWLQLTSRLAEQGFRKIILFNGHGGNSPILQIIITELRIRYNIIASLTSVSRLLKSSNVLSCAEQAYDIHAGKIETSLMLAINPNLVNMKAAQNFANKQIILEQQFKLLRAYGAHQFGWAMEDLNPAGATGDAAAANIGFGQILLDSILIKLILFIEEVDQFELSSVKDK